MIVKLKSILQIQNEPQIFLLILVVTILLVSCGVEECIGTPSVERSTASLALTRVVSTVTAIQLTQVPTVRATSMPVTLTLAPGRPTFTPTATSTPTITPQPSTSTPAATPVISEVVAQLTEEEIFYLDGGQFPPEVWKVDLRTLNKARIFYNDTPGFEIGSIALSPDKKFLASDFYFYDPVSLQAINRSGLQIMRTDGSELRILVQTTESDWAIGAPGWSPDGSQIAYLREYLTPGGYPPLVYLHVLNLDTGHDRVITEDGGLFCWSPKGNRIVYTGRNDHGVYVLDLHSGLRETLWEDEKLTFGWPVWQPGGEEIAIAVVVGEMRPSTSPEAGLYLINATSQERRKLVDGDIYDISWSPSGLELIYSTLAGRGNHLWLMNVEYGSSVKWLDTTVKLGTPAWSEDGRALLLSVEEKLEQSYWISVLAVSDQSLFRLVLAETMKPYSTW
jgi:dipeptidyl aminopeptidase/acylaminoacyl peptidase